MSYRHVIYEVDANGQLTGVSWLSFFEDDIARTTTRYNQAGAVVSVEPYTAEQNANADAQIIADTKIGTKVSLDTKVRNAVAVGGLLDTILGSADVAWTPGTALTLRGGKAMTLANIQALNLSNTQQLINKLFPLLVGITQTLRQEGKLIVQVFDNEN